MTQAGGTPPPSAEIPDTPGQLQVPQPTGGQPHPDPIEPEKPADVDVLKAENCLSTLGLPQAGQLTLASRLMTSFSKTSPHP